MRHRGISFTFHIKSVLMAEISVFTKHTHTHIKSDAKTRCSGSGLQVCPCRTHMAEDPFPVMRLKPAPSRFPYSRKRPRRSLERRLYITLPSCPGPHVHLQRTQNMLQGLDALSGLIMPRDPQSRRYRSLGDHASPPRARPEQAEENG